MACFTDQENDPESGLMYYGARYYDPWVGRFLSQDPGLIGPVGGMSFAGIAANSGNFNAYSYALNAPTVYTDPTGRTSFNQQHPSTLFTLPQNTRSGSSDSETSDDSGADGGGPESPGSRATGVRQGGVQVAKLELAPGSTPAFKNQVGQAVTGLNKAGAAGVLADLENEKGVVNLQEGSGGTMNYDPVTQTITWDPTSGLRVPGGVQSPALGLVHEGDHALGHLRGNLAPTPAAEELRVIKGAEADAAGRLNQPTRSGHIGLAIPVRCPTCTQ